LKTKVADTKDPNKAAELKDIRYYGLKDVWIKIKNDKIKLINDR